MPARIDRISFENVYFIAQAQTWLDYRRVFCCKLLMIDDFFFLQLFSLLSEVGRKKEKRKNRMKYNYTACILYCSAIQLDYLQLEMAQPLTSL